jgi:hypothetical protein
MSQMNKRPGGSDRRKQLEDELTKDVTDQASAVETGRDRVETPFKQRARQANSIFNMQQGRRRRHPTTTLQTYANMRDVGDGDKWKKAFTDEQERVQVPEEHLIDPTGLVANQMGLTNTAKENAKKSKPRLTANHYLG